MTTAIAVLLVVHPVGLAGASALAILQDVVAPHAAVRVEPVLTVVSAQLIVTAVGVGVIAAEAVDVSRPEARDTGPRCNGMNCGPPTLPLSGEAVRATWKTTARSNRTTP